MSDIEYAFEYDFREYDMDFTKQKNGMYLIEETRSAFFYYRKGYITGATE